MKIYLIDDDEIDLVIGKKILEIADSTVEVSTSQHPIEALSNLISNNIQPDVIILDWYMAELEGEDWLISYCTQAQTLAPVYIFTASINPEDRLKASKFDIVKGYFIKPFSRLNIEQILPLCTKTRN